MSDRTPHQIAVETLRHLTGTLLVLDGGVAKVAGHPNALWLRTFARIAERRRRDELGALMPALWHILDRVRELKGEELTLFGAIARNLLAFAQNCEAPRGSFVAFGIRAVTATFATDSIESRRVILPFLGPVHLREHGYEDLHWLADSVPTIAVHDLELVEEIYRAAFSHNEDVDEPVPLGGGQLLRLVESRRQAYEHSWWILATAFPTVIALDFLAATRIIAAVLPGYVELRRRSLEERENLDEGTFDFRGQEVRLQRDYSSIWDSGGTYGEDDAVRIFDLWTERLAEIAREPGDQALVIDVLELIARTSGLAVFWRRILNCGTQAPKTLGKLLLEAVLQPPLLTAIDTSREAGEYLRAVYPALSTGDRERAERALLALRATVEGGQGEREKDVARLLNCLPTPMIALEETREAIEAFAAAGPIPDNTPLLGPITSGSGPWDVRDKLQEGGVPVDARPNADLLTLEKAARDFSSSCANSVPEIATVSTVLPSLRSLWLAVMSGEASGAHPKQITHSWGVLVEACAFASHTQGLVPGHDPGRFLRQVLLASVEHPDPEYSEERAQQFRRGPFWDCPSVRVHVAEGLTLLAREPGFADGDVLASVERLASDPVPAVRYQVAHSIRLLRTTAPKVVEGVLVRLGSKETDEGVLQAFIAGSAHRLAVVMPDATLPVLFSLVERFGDASEPAENVADGALGVISDMHVWHANEQCAAVIDRVIASTADHPERASGLIARLRGQDALTRGELVEAERDAVRVRALGILDRVVCEATASAGKSVARMLRGESLDEAENKRLGKIAKALDNVSLQLYFASGAFDAKGKAAHQDAELSPQQRRFFDETLSVMERLAAVGLAPITQHVVETLSFFVEYRPKEVLRLLASAVVAGDAGGYSSEAMAASVVVDLVKRYLASYPDLIRDSAESRRALLDILNAFVRAGWPEARRLVYSIREVFA